MAIVKKVALRIWSLWCIASMCVLLAIMYPILVVVILLNNENLIKKCHAVPPFFAKMMLWSWGVRFEFHNKEIIDKQKQFIFISNHRSYLDALVAGVSIDNYTKFLGKAEILNWPVFGFLLKHFYIPVWRNDKQHRAWSMEQMEEKIAGGYSIFICPEGTCNTTTDFFTRFYDGAFKLAAESKINLVPLTFIATGELMPRNDLLLIPGKVSVFFHEPIPYSEIDLNDLEKIKVRVQEIMRNDLLKYYPSGHF